MEDEKQPLIGAEEQVSRGDLAFRKKERKEGERYVSIKECAEMVVGVLVPVAVTMLLTVVFVRIVYVHSEAEVVRNVSFALGESASQSDGSRLLSAVVNAAILLALIIATTFLVYCCYKNNCAPLIGLWLMLSVVSILGVVGGYLVWELLTALNVAMDMVTFGFIMWNFAFIGTCSVFGDAPKLLKQAYLVAISVIVACYFVKLPEWTAWAILYTIAIYDIYAVLCKNGPLKLLLNEAERKKEPIPALLYSASLWMTMANADDFSEMPERVRKRLDRSNEGLRLGLGDFVFYSVLMGRAALSDTLTVATCFVAVLTGLFGTLIFLGIFKQAMPALPISIALGALFYYTTRIFLVPFVVSNGMNWTLI